jgi:TolB-like protein
MKMRIVTHSTLLLAAIIVAGIPARAETPPPITIGVLNFDSSYKPLLKDVTALVTADLSANPQFTLVERAQLNKVMGEQALGSSGTISADSAARIGQLTGAKILVTGHIFKLNREVVVTASIIGTETGRMFSDTESANWTNVVALSSNISARITQTITDQYTNLVTNEVRSRDEQIERLIQNVKGTRRPSVSLHIVEQSGASPKKRRGKAVQLEKGADADGALNTTETEMGTVLQKAGFKVVDEKSEDRPDVVITGNAVADTEKKRGNLFSCAALVQIKAQDRQTGNIISVDRQESTVADMGRQTAVEKAFANATDTLLERLLPRLAE